MSTGEQLRPASLFVPHPRDALDAYIQAFRLFSNSRINLTIVNDRGAVLALSPLAIRQSRWPFPDILSIGIPEVTRHLYVEPAEEAWSQNRIVSLPPTPYSTASRDLLLAIRHIPLRDPIERRYVTLAVTSHIVKPGLWQPPEIQSQFDRQRFADLLETQAVLWAEANAWLKSAAKRGGSDVQKAARIASGAGRRLEAMLEAFLTVSSNFARESVVPYPR